MPQGWKVNEDHTCELRSIRQETRDLLALIQHERNPRLWQVIAELREMEQEMKAASQAQTNHFANTKSTKICAACGKSKGRSFYRKQQWELKGSKRCTECLRHKNPKPGGREIWHAMTQAIFLK
jgi:hypothetical protein